MFPVAPGRMIDVGGHRLHLLCVGGNTGAPPVILDAALGASCLSWSHVQPAVSALTQCCAYDRAGFGWSDAGPLPRTAGRLAGELRLLLRHAAIPGPYILVGHSFGGLVVRLFAARHPDLVAGMVLIETAIVEDWIDPSADRRLLIARGVRLGRYGSWAARAGIARVVSSLASGGAFEAARVLVKIIGRGGVRRPDEELLSPIWKLPGAARATLQQMWSQPKFFQALGSQIEHISTSAAMVLRDEDASLHNLPLVVMTASRADEARLTADAALAARSRFGRHVVVPDCGHWIPLDAPQAVVEAIEGVVRASGR